MRGFVCTVVLGAVLELHGAEAFVSTPAMLRQPYAPSHRPRLLDGRLRSCHLLASDSRSWSLGAPAGARGTGLHCRRLAKLEMSAGAGEAAGEPQKAGMLAALYKFTRPHTIRGTILASCACVTRVMLKCIETQPVIEWRLLQTAFFGLVALLCGNAYIVGINQIYDVDIDKVNKPFLPVAAGEISKPLAWALVVATGILGLAIVKFVFSTLICQLYCFGMFLGTVYTIPPFRWKNNPVLAAFSIAMVRGLLLNVGLHHAASTALGLAISWPAQVCFIAAFMTVFATVIAVAKDLPDVEGDIKYGVKTLASSLGVAKAAHLVVLALMGNYVMGVGVGLLAEGINNRPLMVVAHSALAGWLAVFASKLQPDSIPSIKLFYRNIWKLFYAEYLLFPFI